MIVRWRSITDSGTQSTDAKNSHKTGPHTRYYAVVWGLVLFLLVSPVINVEIESMIASAEAFAVATRLGATDDNLGEIPEK